tara:strand:- start:1274 stop:1993 length:720 start_codon:yes stop_codon:yes gene_type:complete
MFHQLNFENSIVESDEVIFHISGGNLIEYNFTKKLSKHKKQLKILHQAIPSLLFQRKIFVLHGSAFEYRGKAIILMGSSGSGKSESLNIIKNENKIISDDIIAVEFSDNKAICLSGLSALCIHSEDSIKPLNDMRHRSLEIISNKQMVQNKLIISDIFFLNWEQENSIEVISATESLKQIILNSFRPIPTGNCKDSEKFYLSSVTKIIDRTEQYTFGRKKGNICNSIEKLNSYLKKKYD